MIANARNYMVRVLPLTLLLPALCVAGEVIAHAAVTLTAAEVKEVFLGDKQLAGGVKLVPVDNASAQAEFVTKVLQLETTKYNTLWTKKAFREGLNAPAVKGGDAEVVAFVKATPGAIGYVSAAPAGSHVISKY